MLPLFLHTVALAGDVALYDRAVDLVERHYLRPEAVDAAEMFRAAGRQLEGRVEWLLVDAGTDTLQLRDGGGKWSAEVRLLSADELPQALARLEDAVRGAGLPLDEEFDPRVEILRGAIRTLDRHSVILHAASLERFDERLSGVLSGIGSTLSLREDRLVITDLVPNGPAERAGLRAGDHVARIDGVSTVGMVPADATERIRGVAGTAVTLLLRDPAGAAREVRVSREEITIRNVTASVADNGVGVITIDHFSEQTRAWLDHAIEDLRAKHAISDGLVIDLRGNTGGSLHQSAHAADAFVSDGTLVTTAGRGGAPMSGLVARIDARPEHTPSDIGPIVVLMDPATASGAEILAGALAAHDRAALLGQRSFGKGTVQKLYQVDPAIKLKLTVAEWLVAGHTRVADVGLTPDLTVDAVAIDGDAVRWDPDAEMSPVGHVAWVDDGVRDTPLTIAAALARAATSPTRASVLEAATAALPALRADEQEHLAAAFAARGVDWTAPARAQHLDGVRATARVDGEAQAGGTANVEVVVTNDGPTIWRAAIRLRSSSPVWDGAVLPIGQLRAGESRVVRTPVRLRDAADTRTDDVTLELEAERASPVTVGAARLAVRGAPTPVVGVSARLRPDARVEGVDLLPGSTLLALDVTLVNRGSTSLSDVQVRLPFPAVDGVELVDARSGPLALSPGKPLTTTLRLAVTSPDAPRVVPLDIDVLVGAEAHRYPLDVSRRGERVRREPPQIVAVAAGPVLPIGSTTLSIAVSDDARVDHVTVTAGVETAQRRRSSTVYGHEDDKVAWVATGARRGDFTVAVPVREGVNRYRVVAEDDVGARTIEDVYVLGEVLGDAPEALSGE